MPAQPFQQYRFDFDIAKVVDKLHEALGPLIRDLTLTGKHNPVDSETYIQQNKTTRQVELLQQRSVQEEPCSLSKLVDIKAVFDVMDVRTGLRGMREEAFLSVVAPVLCPSYPYRVREWFCTVDTTETGVVGWRSLSQHLASRGLHLGESLSREFKQLELATASSSQDADAEGARPPLQFDEKPDNHLAFPTGFHVTKPHYLNVGRKRGFVCACDDGCIRYFDSTSSGSLHRHDMLHFADNVSQFRMADMKISKEKPHAYVADAAGVVLVYDTDQTCGRTGTIFKGYRLQSSNSVKPLSITKTVKFDPLKMERPGMQMSNNRNPQFVKVDVDLLGLQSPVDVARHMVTAIEPRSGGYISGVLGAGSSSVLGGGGSANGGGGAGANNAGGSGLRDINFFVGWSEGTIVSYSPEVINTVTLGPTQVIKGIHTNAVTCMQHHTANVELRGLISCSLDGSLVVTDLERSTVKMRFANASASANPLTTSNWVSTVGSAADVVGGATDYRSLTQFDVSNNLPIIAAAGTQRYVTLWSGQSRRHLVTFADHRDDVVSIHFNNLYELVTMGSDRTIRVYDIRTYRPVQVIRDKERKYSGDPLTGMCIDGEDQSIVAWSGTPFTHRPIQGAVVLLAQGHPVTFADMVEDENGLSIALTSNDVFELHAADSGDTVFKYVCQRGPIKAVAHDDSWKRIFVLSDSMLEVVIVGERKPSRIFDTGSYHLRALGFLQGQGPTPSYIVGGNANSILFLSERNGTGVLQQEHNIPLLSLTKHKDSRRVEVVTVLSCHSDSGRVVVGTASGEVAVIMVTRNKANVVFVFGADAVTLTKTVALMKRNKFYTGAGKKLWERAVVATKKDDALGGKAFTEFRHERQGRLNHQCDSITLIGDRHCIVGFGSGEAAIAEINGAEDTRYVARFPAAFSTGIGCCYAFWDNVLVCGDDEGYITRFDCQVHSKPLVVVEGGDHLRSGDAQQQSAAAANGGRSREASTVGFGGTATATSVRTEKYFLDCYVAITNITNLPFAITAIAMRANIIVVGLECGKCVALCPNSLQFLWKGDVLIQSNVVYKAHQFITYFGAAALVGGLYQDDDDGKSRGGGAALGDDVAEQGVVEKAKEKAAAAVDAAPPSAEEAFAKVGINPFAKREGGGGQQPKPLHAPTFPLLDSIGGAASPLGRRRESSMASSTAGPDTDDGGGASEDRTASDPLAGTFSFLNETARSARTGANTTGHSTARHDPKSTAITAAMIRNATLSAAVAGDKKHTTIITEETVVQSVPLPQSHSIRGVAGREGSPTQHANEAMSGSNEGITAAIAAAMGGAGGGSDIMEQSLLTSRVHSIALNASVKLQKQQLVMVASSVAAAGQEHAGGGATDHSALNTQRDDPSAQAVMMMTTRTVGSSSSAEGSPILSGGDGAATAEQVEDMPALPVNTVTCSSSMTRVLSLHHNDNGSLTLSRKGTSMMTSAAAAGGGGGVPHSARQIGGAPLPLLSGGSLHRADSSSSGAAHRVPLPLAPTTATMAQNILVMGTSTNSTSGVGGGEDGSATALHDNGSKIINIGDNAHNNSSSNSNHLMERSGMAETQILQTNVGDDDAFAPESATGAPGGAASPAPGGKRLLFGLSSSRPQSRAATAKGSAGVLATIAGQRRLREELCLPLPAKKRDAIQMSPSPSDPLPPPTTTVVKPTPSSQPLAPPLPKPQHDGDTVPSRDTASSQHLLPTGHNASTLMAIQAVFGTTSDEVWGGGGGGGAGAGGGVSAATPAPAASIAAAGNTTIPPLPLPPTAEQLTSSSVPSVSAFHPIDTKTQSNATTTNCSATSTPPPAEAAGSPSQSDDDGSGDDSRRSSPLSGGGDSETRNNKESLDEGGDDGGDDSLLYTATFSDLAIKQPLTYTNSATTPRRIFRLKGRKKRNNNRLTNGSNLSSGSIVKGAGAKGLSPSASFEGLDGVGIEESTLDADDAGIVGEKRYVSTVTTYGRVMHIGMKDDATAVLSGKQRSPRSRSGARSPLNSTAKSGRRSGGDASGELDDTSSGAGALPFGLNGSYDYYDEMGRPMTSDSVVMRHKQGGIGGNEAIGAVVEQMSPQLKQRLGLYTPPTSTTAMRHQRLVDRSALPPRPGTSEAYARPSVNIGAPFPSAAFGVSGATGSALSVFASVAGAAKNNGSRRGLPPLAGTTSGSPAASDALNSSAPAALSGTLSGSSSNANRRPSSSTSVSPAATANHQQQQQPRGRSDSRVTTAGDLIADDEARKMKRDSAVGSNAGGSRPLTAGSGVLRPITLAGSGKYMGRPQGAEGGGGGEGGEYRPIASALDAIGFLANRCSYLSDFTTTPLVPPSAAILAATAASASSSAQKGVGEGVNTAAGGGGDPSIGSALPSATRVPLLSIELQQQQRAQSPSHHYRPIAQRRAASASASASGSHGHPIHQQQQQQQQSYHKTDADVFAAKFAKMQQQHQKVVHHRKGSTIGSEAEGYAAENARLLQQKRGMLPASAKKNVRNPSLCYQRLSLDRVNDPKLPPSGTTLTAMGNNKM